MARSTLRNVIVRDAGMPDAERLPALMTQLGYPTGADAMRSRLTKILAREDFQTWIADVSGNVVAMAGVQLSPSYERDGTVGRLVAFVVDEFLGFLGVLFFRRGFLDFRRFLRRGLQAF